MSRFLKFFLILTSLASFSLYADTVKVFGKYFPTEHEANENSPQLFLQGAAVRKVYGMVNTYVGLLYIGDTSVKPDLIASTDMPRRMEFHLLSNRVTARRFVNVIEEGLALNTTREEMVAIEPRVQELFKLFDYKWTKGTIGWIEWVPEKQASRVVINDNIRGYVAGKDLSDALLRIWIGDRPVSERFKRQVLGLEGLETESDGKE